MGRGKSVERVERAARELGLDIEIRRTGGSTRTAAEAAAACGCEVAQIVKTLMFQGQRSGELYALLIPGDRRLDLDKAAAAVGETLVRADARRVREVTGFAIGGVSAIGHLQTPRLYADRSLTAHPLVWTAAGAQDAVFAAAPETLLSAAGATLAELS